MGGLLSLWKAEMNPETDLVDLHGKVAIVTGGNSGIGFRTCQFLARNGAKVYMAARNESKAVAAIADLERQGLNGGSVVFLNCNLPDPHAVKKAAETFLQLETRLDILVNNAAMPAVPFEMTNEGLSAHMQINHIGHFILTDVLLDLLKSTSRQEGADVRIVNVTSAVYKDQNVPKFDRAVFTQRYGTGTLNNIKSYGLSKLANILHINELQRRLSSEGYNNIVCVSLHPGIVVTPQLRIFFEDSFPYFGRQFSGWLARTFGRDETCGAWTPTFAAAGVGIQKDKEKYKGAYLTWWNQIEVQAANARDEQLAKQLWQTTEAILKELNI